MQVNYGLAEEQHIPSLATSLLQTKYDYAIAYTSEGYWQSDHVYYLILAFKDGVYYNGTIKTQRAKDKDRKWPAPVMKVKTADPAQAKQIINYLHTSGLWQLKQDSLNDQYLETPDGKSEWMTIHDATNYRFELIKPSGVLMVYAYAPEEFLEAKPNSTDRKKFIKIRDRFLSFYKAL